MIADFKATFLESEQLTVRFKTSDDFNAEFGEVYRTGEHDYYEGEYTFTPTAHTQIVEIANKVAIENITINPIPSNYGLITWNGVTLTVS